MAASYIISLKLCRRPQQRAATTTILSPPSIYFSINQYIKQSPSNQSTQIINHLKNKKTISPQQQQTTTTTNLSSRHQASKGI